MTSVTGEICNGIAYIDWKQLHAPSASSAITRCIGRRHTFTLHRYQDDPSTSSGDVGGKYVRSVGSTAVLYTAPDAYGRRIGRAQTLGPWAARGVEVGPLEEKLVDLAGRVDHDGYQAVLVEPLHVLKERTIAVADRSGDLLKEAIFPFHEFIRKLRNRVPQLATESYDLATSIRIEIKIEDGDSKE